MRSKKITRLAAVGAATVLASGLAGCRWTGWNDTASRATAADATAWLVDQQQPDGGFEVAGMAGFETPDALIAIAENAQTSSAWDKSLALAAVQATTTNGKSPLDYVDDLAEGPIGGGTAAKLTVLVALPLGLSPTSFDPQGDGAVNLIAIMNGAQQPNGSYGTFSDTLFAAIASRANGGSVPASTLSHIRATQKADGSWDYLGDPSGVGYDIDTTALAIQALSSAGLDETDADVSAGLAYLAANQQASGAWQSFGSDDPNSTAMAIMAISGAGFDPAKACWRDRVAPALASQPYVSPLPWLNAQAAGDGHIASPADAWGVNTFATSQSIQAMRRAWMPVNSLIPRRGC